MALVVFPSFVCQLLALPAPDGLWIRLAGMFMLILAYYCFRAAREDSRAFIRWTLGPRFLVLPFLLLLFAGNLASPWLLVFGIVDAAASFWTARALASTE